MGCTYSFSFPLQGIPIYSTIHHSLFTPILIMVRANRSQNIQSLHRLMNIWLLITGSKTSKVNKWCKKGSLSPYRFSPDCGSCDDRTIPKNIPFIYFYWFEMSRFAIYEKRTYKRFGAYALLSNRTVIVSPRCIMQWELFTLEIYEVVLLMSRKLMIWNINSYNNYA